MLLFKDLISEDIGQAWQSRCTAFLSFYPILCCFNWLPCCIKEVVLDKRQHTDLVPVALWEKTAKKHIGLLLTSPSHGDELCCQPDLLYYLTDSSYINVVIPTSIFQKNCLKIDSGGTKSTQSFLLQIILSDG